jgi:hypothetical protein
VGRHFTLDGCPAQGAPAEAFLGVDDFPSLVVRLLESLGALQEMTGNQRKKHVYKLSEITPAPP